MAAMGHYGNKSPALVKHYAQDLGFEYFSAANKEEYLAHLEQFITPEITDKPLLFEVFTDYQKESDALNLINHIVEDAPTASEKAKNLAKGLLGEKNIKTLKHFIKG